MSTQVDITSDRDDTQFTDEFKHTVNVLKLKAKTEAFNNKDVNRFSLLDQINSTVIVPDEKLANKDNNELNLTVFVRMYLPKSEWPNYIPKINL